jgi:hypothetical protein
MYPVAAVASRPSTDAAAAEFPGYASDQYRFVELLTPAERSVLGKLRRVLDTQVQPLVADYWERGEFPYQILPPLVELNLMRPAETPPPAPSPAACTTASATSSWPAPTPRSSPCTTPSPACSAPR